MRTVSEVAHDHHIPPATLRYHLRCSGLKPTRQIGGRCVYSPAAVRKLLKFYAARKRTQRPSTSKQTILGAARSGTNLEKKG